MKYAPHFFGPDVYELPAGAVLWVAQEPYPEHVVPLRVNTAQDELAWHFAWQSFASVAGEVNTGVPEK